MKLLMAENSPVSATTIVAAFNWSNCDVPSLLLSVAILDTCEGESGTAAWWGELRSRACASVLVNCDDLLSTCSHARGRQNQGLPRRLLGTLLCGGVAAMARKRSQGGRASGHITPGRHPCLWSCCCPWVSLRRRRSTGLSGQHVGEIVASSLKIGAAIFLAGFFCAHSYPAYLLQTVKSVSWWLEVTLIALLGVRAISRGLFAASQYWAPDPVGVGRGGSSAVRRLFAPELPVCVCPCRRMWWGVLETHP